MRPTYRRAWQQGHHCLMPMLGFFEPCYESGKAERWRIGMADSSPFAVAGLAGRAWLHFQLFSAHDQRRHPPATATDSQTWR
ncbi:SOS response-associated peptidase family protein [Aeromonas hydrophila]|uniref:SOS response-associated peptidase family protein n=1 Tax=Aeromonas hydrophila TaxID=644 RepID=UPI0035B5F445